MAERLKVGLRASRELYGSQEYTIVLEVTNTGDKPLTSLEVIPQLVPGIILGEQETQNTTELDILEDGKRRLFREMEEQIASAYEQQKWKELTHLQKVMIAYGRMPDIIASRLTGQKARIFRLPYWTTEATKIDNLDDIERLERDYIAKEEADSLLRTSFSADKEKVLGLMGQIKVRNLEGESEEVFRLLPGDTLSFSYRCRAPHLYRQKVLDCQFRINYHESENKKTGNVTAGDSFSFYASAFSIPFGAILGACAGFIVKTAFVTSGHWFNSDFWIQLAGSVLLAIIVAFVTSRSPEKKKAVTAEDFIGGFIIGAVASLFSEQIIKGLSSLAPAVSTSGSALPMSTGAGG